jgi:hypothetical protein
VAEVRDSSDGHRDEPRAAQCQSEAVEVHTLNTTSRRPTW